MSPHEQYILDQMLVEARVMMMDGSPLELDPSQFSDCVTGLIWRLREAERDAARYRWLRDIGQHKYYVDDILACTLRGADGCIDEYMKEKGDE